MVLDTVEIELPEHGIHNQTSALFAQAGITALVRFPSSTGPYEVTLPFESPMDFMKIMKWRMTEQPTYGNIVTVESSDLHEAVDLIRQAGESAA